MKYFEIFELHDQSQYWETDNAADCLIRFDRLSDAFGYSSPLFDDDDEDEDDDEDFEEMISTASRMDEALFKRGGIGAGLN